MARKSPPPRRRRMAHNVARYHSVNLSRSGRSDVPAMAPLHAQAVTGAAECVNQLRLESVVDLAAQPADQYFEDVRKRIVVVVPYMRGDQGTVDHPVAVFDEAGEQRELLGGQFDLLARAR